MNPEQKEKRAASFLEFFLEGSSVIQTEFHRNDKTPIIDGFIRLYDVKEGEDRSKSKLIDQVFVQIKGTTQKDFLKKRKFQIEMADLMGLKKMGGGIFFVVYLVEGKEKIFFRSLLPYELNNIDSSKGSRVFDFFLLDQKLSVVHAEFKNFILHRDKQQKNVLNIKYSDTDSLNVTTKVIAANEKQAYEILNRGIALYHTTEEGIEIPIGMIEKDSQLYIEDHKILTVNGYELDYQIVTKPRSEKYGILIGNFLELYFSNKKFRINFNIKDTKKFSDVLTGLRAFEDIMKNGYYFKENLIELGKYVKSINEIDRILKIKNDYEEINTLFDTLGFDKKIDFFNLDNEVHKQIATLLKIKENIGEQEPRVLTIELESCLYYILVGPNMLFNIFLIDDKYTMIYGEDGEFLIFPSLFPRDRLECVRDFDTKKILENIILMIEKNKASIGYVNGYVLDILATYDRTGEERFFLLAESVMNIIIKEEKDIVYLINYYQIIARKRLLSIFEIDHLEKMLESVKTEEERICIDILLKKDVTKLIEDLNEEDRETFNSWPITQLLKNSNH